MVLKDGVVPVSRIRRRKQESGDPLTMDGLFSDSSAVLSSLRALHAWADAQTWAAERVATADLLAPVSHPGKILCVGLNYRTHIEESGMTLPSFPVLFSKFGNSVRGPGEPVAIPAVAQQVDYEAELVMVMGKVCANVAEADALDYVLGYTCGNDLSARDLQFRTGQWLLGKSLEGFAPMGPYLTLAEDMSPDNAGIQCWVNGELRQHDTTANLIFSCATLVSYISRYMTLVPGDVIFTGTPHGTMMGWPADRQAWLRPGDEVVVEIEGIGRLVTPLI